MASNNFSSFIRTANTTKERLYIPSSLFAVNDAIDNVKGFQTGRLLEIVGQYSSGKTTLALDLIRNAQQMGLKAAFVDAERTFDSDYAQLLGVDTNTLLLVNTDTAEQACSVMEHLIIEQGVQLLVLDSLPTIVPADEVNKDYDDNPKMAVAAGLLKRFMLRIVPICDNHNCLLVILNQYRANFSTMSRVEKKPYGSYAIHHAMTWLLELSRVKNEEGLATIQVKATKNKLGSERGVAEFYLRAGKGIDTDRDLLTKAMQRDIIVRKGAWYEFEGIKAQGADSVFDKIDRAKVRKLCMG